MANIIFTEASGVADSIFGKSQAPIKAFLEHQAEAFEAEGIYNKVFKEETSDKYGEKYTSLVGNAGIQPTGEAGEPAVSGMKEGPSKFLENVTWTDSMYISREMIDDAQVIDLKKAPTNLLNGYYRGKELYAAATLGNAMNGNTAMTYLGKSFDLTCNDGYQLFYNAHPGAYADVDTQSNIFSDTVDSDALGKLQTKMQNFCDPAGNILAVSPDTIIIPNDADIKKAVFAAVSSDKTPENANNAFNYQFGMWNVIVWPYLNKYVASGDTPWILFDSKFNEMYDGAVWQNRNALEINSEVQRNKVNVWDIYARFVAGFVDWRAFAIGGIASASSL